MVQLVTTFARPRIVSAGSAIGYRGSTAGGIGIYWRPADFGRVAGRTYVAWCLAAVSLPVLAGYLFDLTRGYGAAVMIAGVGNLAGMALALTLPRQGWRDRG